PLVPFVGAGAAMAGVTAWMERHTVGAHGPEWSFTPTQRVLIAGRALWFYATKLVWPVPLAFNYERWTVDSAQAWQWAFPLGAAALVVALWVGRRRLGRGPLAAVLFFAGTLAPALGFVDVYPMRYAFVADHFQYLASLGLIALAAALGTKACQQLSPARQWLKPAAGAAVLLILAGLTWQQELVYRDLETLWTDTL